MKPIKQVIIAHYTLPPVIGGVESCLGPLAEMFAKNGYLVTLLAGEGNFEGQNIKTSIIPEFSPNNSHIKNLQRIFRLGSLPESYELELQNLQRRIETEIGDIENVIIHNMMTMPFNLTATEAFWNFIENNPKKNFYIWTHDMAWLMDDYKSHLYKRRPWSLLKEALKEVTYISISEFRKRQMSELLNIPRKKIKVIPDVLKYQDFLRFNEDTSKVISSLSIFKKYPVILLPSRIVPRKNLERSIQIIASLRGEFPDILGIITGITDKDNNELLEYSRILFKLIEDNGLEENIVFLSKVFEELDIPHEKNRDVVRDLYFISHLVLVLSTDEGFGLPILEAGAARIPIVLTQIPVFREIAGDSVLYLPLDESVDYNANRLSKFILNKQSKSDILFRRVFCKYNWDTLWDDYLKPIFEQ